MTEETKKTVHKVIYGKPVDVPRNTFRVELTFMHGDADGESQQTLTFQTVDDLIEFHTVLAWLKSEDPRYNRLGAGKVVLPGESGENGYECMVRLMTDERFMRYFVPDEADRVRLRALDVENLETADDDMDFWDVFNDVTYLWEWDETLLDIGEYSPASLDTVEYFWYNEHGVQHMVTVEEVKA